MVILNSDHIKIIVFDKKTKSYNELIKSNADKSIFDFEHCGVAPSLCEKDLGCFDFILLNFKKVTPKYFSKQLDFLTKKNVIHKTIITTDFFVENGSALLDASGALAYMPKKSLTLFLKHLSTITTRKRKKVIDNTKMIAKVNHAVVKKNNFYVNIDLDNVEYVEVDDNYLIYHCNEEKYIVRDSLSNFLSKYDHLFIRIHGKFAINKKKFLKLDYKEQVVYTINNSLPLSKHYRIGFYNHFSIGN